MTIEEFAEQIGDRLRAGYNAKDREAALAALADADARLRASIPDPVVRARFWVLVGERFHSGRLLMEKQEASALHALMRQIEAELARLTAEADRNK